MKRLYFVEVLAVANVLAIAVLARDHPAIRPWWMWMVSLSLTLLIYTAVGIVVRVIVAYATGRRGYFRHLRRWRWIIDTFRLNVAGGVMFYAYGWIKLSMPVVHPVLFDQQMWDLDQLIFFGLAPTIFFLDLFSNDHLLAWIDWSYSSIFFVSTVVATAYFLSAPGQRVRVAFANGNGVLWIGGAWLYMAFPSLGPAYRFPEIWLVHDYALARSQNMQALLMKNYQSVLRAGRGEPHGTLNLLMGIAAFPSLHVGFQTYVFLWMRRLWTSGEVLFGIFAAVIFLGSMVTGWHYLIDGLAGFVLALACWWIFWRRARMARFLRLFSQPWLRPLRPR